MTQPMTDEQQQRLMFECGRVYSPSAPIDSRDLFAGRISQISQVSSAVGTRGQHAIIFGERGVGKTSLANTIKILLEGAGVLAVKVNCNNTDTFETIWKRIFAEITVTEEQKRLGFGRGTVAINKNLNDIVPSPLDPGVVRRILQQLSQNQECVIVIDEFDRVRTRDHSFADTIKDLSDNSTRATLVFVGVANDVDELITEHASIDRCLVQVKMPRMTSQELNEILRKANNTLQMTFSTEAETLIVLLSNGLPHYTHLLGQESTTVAIQNRRFDIDLSHVEQGIERALEKQQQRIGSSYQNATRSQRKDTLFKDVLLACALAEVDAMGFFISAAVREPLSQITGRDYDIPNFSQHLDRFSSADDPGGAVLEKAGTPRRFRFRFRNPLLQPYVIMKGIADKRISQELLIALAAKSRNRTNGNTLF
jgi:Cdc6-like AAA superfamily ATPase